MREFNTKKAEVVTPLRAVPTQQSASVEKTGSTVLPLTDETFDRKVFSLLGVPIDTLSMAETTTAIDRTINAGGKMWLSTPNLDWLLMAKQDEAFRDTTIAADLSVCDGMPVLLLAKIAGIPLKTRVQGSSLFDRLRQVKPSFRGSRSVFFFGGREGAADKAAEALKAEDGGVSSIGSFNPGFGTVAEMSTDEIVNEASAGNPDLLMVSLSAKKGQLWIAENIDKLSARVIAPLGAVVDFTAGTIQRAPKFFQTFGLEWLWRIKEDPQLAKRYGQNFLALPGFTLRCALIRQLLAFQNRKAPQGTQTSSMTQGATGTTLHLGADCREAALATTRSALKAAVASGTDLHVDFTAVRCFDLALIGLLQLAAHRVGTSGQQFTVGGMTKTARYIMALNDCRFQDKTPTIEEAGEDFSGQVDHIQLGRTGR